MIYLVNYRGSAGGVRFYFLPTLPFYFMFLRILHISDNHTHRMRND